MQNKSVPSGGVMTPANTTTERPLADLQAEAEAMHIQCATNDGKHDAGFTLDRRHKTSGEKKTINVAFIIPNGYKRQTFSSHVDARLSAGGSVKWLNNDPHDGTVVLHGWADAFSYASISVSNVIAVKE